MKTIGLIGGLSWESSIEYYRLINEEVKKKYRGRLIDRYNLEVLVPSEQERKIVHDVIYGELCRGIILPASREAYKRIMETLVSRGAEAIILGCTEISLLVKQEDAAVPLFDTTLIHAQAAVSYALQ